MKPKFISIIVLAAFVLSVQAAYAQNPLDEHKKELEKGIQESLDNMAETLKLEDWQVFYLDSIMTHDFFAMDEELLALQKQKASNTDLYYQIQDKWMDRMYDAFHALMNEDQWNKYLRNGAAKEKKVRDKRAAKRQM